MYVENKHTTMRYDSFENSIKNLKTKLAELKKAANDEGRVFRVIDVGGGHGGNHYGDGAVDAIVDLLPNKDLPESVDFFRANICSDEDWQSVYEDVLKEGKYDFCICRHTLEDVDDPATTVRWLERIAEEGWISVPSYLTELSLTRPDDHHLGLEWCVKNDDLRQGYLQFARGYTHHKWVFFGSLSHRFDEMPVVAYPKMCWMNSLPQEFWDSAVGLPRDQFGGFFDNPVFPQDLSFFWKNTIPVIFVNPSLSVERRWAEHDEKRMAILEKITNANWPAIEKNVIANSGGGMTVEATDLQDWTFLVLIHQALKLPDVILDAYRQTQTSIFERLKAAGCFNESVTLETCPWYGVWQLGTLNADGAYINKPDPRKREKLKFITPGDKPGE